MIIDRTHEVVIADALLDALADLGYDQDASLAGLARATLLTLDDDDGESLREVVGLIEDGLDD